MPITINENVYTKAKGLGITLAQGTAAATANTDLINNAIATNNIVNIVGTGTYYINDPIFMTGNRTLNIDPNIVIRTASTFRHNMIRIGNAEFTGDAQHIYGLSILCATQGTTPGIGTVRRYTSPARLSWQAPGDIAEGALVDVSALTFNTGRVSLTSANGQKLEVAVSAADLSGPTSSLIKVTGGEGSVPVTWVRTSNVTVVTHPGHKKRPGEYFFTCGTNFRAQAKVRDVTANTYSFVDSRANGSGTGETYSVADVTINCTGAWIDHDFLLGSSRNYANAYCIMSVGVNRLEFKGGLRNPWKFGIYMQACTDGRVDVDFDAVAPGSSTAAFQFNGATDHCIGTARGSSSDTIAAAVTGDYPVGSYLMTYDEGNMHNENFLIHDVHGVDCFLDLVRIAGATNCWFRNGRIERTSGSVLVNSGASIAIIEDDNMLNGGELNIDGLTIDGLAVGKSGSTQTGAVFIDGTPGAGPISKGLVIRNVIVQYPNDENGRGVIEWRNGNFEDITVERVSHRDPTWTGNVVSFLGVGTASCKTFTIRDCHLRIDNALKNTTWRSTLVTGASSLVVNKLVIEDCSITDISAAGTKSTPFITFQGDFDYVIMRDCRFDGTLDIAYVAATGVDYMTVDNIYTNNVGFGVRFDFPVTEIQVGNIFNQSTIADIIRIGYSSATMRVRSLGGMPPTPTSGFHVNIAAGTSNSPNVNGLDMVCDTTKLFAATGNMVKSSATSRVVMYDGTNWTAIA